MTERLGNLTAADVFRELGIKPESITSEAEGRGNRAYLTERFVVRIAKNEYSQYLDHERECKIAKAMLIAGVHTARPVAWSRSYSVWERMPGETIKRGETASNEVWNALLDDLELIRNNPPESPKTLEPWSSPDVEVLEKPSVLEALTQQEREDIRRIITKPREVYHPAFIHGDAFSENVMVYQGNYKAIIDWSNAGWYAVEHEFAMLEERAYKLALGRYAKHLDLPLLGAIRLNIGLVVASYGLIDWKIVRQGLREALEYSV